MRASTVLIASYDYHDEQGNVALRVDRYEPKTFRQRRPCGSGGWAHGMKRGWYQPRGADYYPCKQEGHHGPQADDPDNQPHPEAVWLEDAQSFPYCLPELLASTGTVYVVEGEKDADRLREAGLIATCNAGGAGKWKLEFGPYLQGRSVVTLADNDEAGCKHAMDVASKLKGSAQSIKILQLPGLPVKGDVSDYFALGGTTEGLLELAASTPEWEVAPQPQDPHQAANEAPLIGNYRLDQDGLWYVDQNPDADKRKPDQWVCSPLIVQAHTRGVNGEDWGKLLSWSDADGQIHEWPMPMALLAGDGTELRERLLSMGLLISPDRRARQYLAEYLMTAQPAERFRCVSSVGWHGGVYVMPDRTFGEVGERVIYQTSARIEHAYRIQGSLEEWQQHVGRLCVENSRLAFAVSATFAAAVLKLSDDEGGGFHFRGGSSTGKTTMLEVAASVWGGGERPRYLQSWRTTSNGLEAVAELHNDALLCLDELGQIDPREAGEAAYTLANGRAKARANRQGGARRRAGWRLLFLSAGEISLRDHMLAGGKSTRGGQDVRMADIPVDAGKGLGGFEELHGSETPDAFSRRLKLASAAFYGTPINAFLNQLVSQDHTTVAQALRTYQEDFVGSCVPAGASGEVFRAARRFGLVAAAGEMATDAGVLPWPEGEATRATKACFIAWLDARGGNGARDIAEGIAQVRAFLEAHGESRFTQLDEGGFSDLGSTARPTINRAGYRRTREGQVEFLILSEAFRREVCAGFDSKLIAQALREHGHLVTGPDGKLTDSIRIPGLNTRPRFFRVKATILEGE